MLAAAEEAPTLHDRLDQIFGEPRAEAISVTELTGAVSAGERGEASRIARRYGMTLTAVWNIDPRSDVCDICRPLDGQPEDVWQDVYRNGPPGHPHCACHLSWELDGRKILN